MARYTQEELKHMAKVIMFNPESQKSQEVIHVLAAELNMHPMLVLAQIDQLTQGERL